MERGRIIEIREMCVHDGPGVRTTVFLQGCPLRCVWCQNPESQDTSPQVLFSESLCTDCGTCRKHCPNGCNPARCTACGVCASVCPQGCRRLCGQTMTSEELAARVNRQRDFLIPHGGGVTFSGGEPMMQASFVLETVSRLRPLHLAVETCGYASPAVYRAVVSAMDWVFQDVKLMDDASHRVWTGRGNARILENVRWLLADGGRPCVLRVPLIPGVTDTRENLSGIASLAAGSRWLERVELLPYNAAAGAKYRLLGRPYSPSFDEQAPSRPDVRVFLEAGVPFCVM